MNGLAYDLILKPFEHLTLGQLRAELLGHAQGKTLEIGIGTGINLPYYPKNIEVIGIEPDEEMRQRASKRAQEFAATVTEGDAMKLPFKDRTFDTVVGTLVFCTIPDPRAAIHEAYRVLKPSGQLLLLEHVRRNTPVAGRFLDLMTPLWSHVAGGCHLNRDPSGLIQEIGFEVLEYRCLWKGLGKFWVLKKPNSEKDSVAHRYRRQ